jgi:hypothetical protein
MSLPLFIQRRLYPFKNYVYDALFPDAYKGYLLKNKTKEEKRKIISKMNDIVNECSYACFIFSLKQLFEEGTKSASEAVTIFKSMGVDKFSIGKKEFSENNDNVLEGKKLYEIMLSSINNEALKQMITESNYYSQIIDRYKDVLLV